jgi:hypothetical protein
VTRPRLLYCMTVRLARVAALALGLMLGLGCDRQSTGSEYPYETIKFVPYDIRRAEIPTDQHDFRGIGFVLPENPGSLTSNPLVAEARINRFKSGTGACGRYLDSADPRLAALAVRLYNMGIGDSRIVKVEGFRAFCVKVDYLGAECERAIDHATDRALQAAWESGQAQQFPNETSQSIGAYSALVSMQEKLERCYPEAPASSSRTFWSE